jgi:hypothetical protein
VLEQEWNEKFLTKKGEDYLIKICNVLSRNVVNVCQVENKGVI